MCFRFSWLLCKCFGLISVAASVAACAPTVANKSFPLTIEQARSDLWRIKADPISLARPLVIISGYADPGVSPALLSREFRQITGDDRIATVVLPPWVTMDECRRLVVREVERRFPSQDPKHTVEVDVIGLSMGGVVARYAASDLAPAEPEAVRGKRLRPKRLFTIGSPHRGADLAALPALTKQHAALRGDSEFLTRLNAPGADGSGPLTYEIVAYTRLEDGIVGEHNTAPPNQVARWVPRPPLETGHYGSMHDPRITADIARWLRNEQPWAKAPLEPLPTSRSVQQPPLR